ncbi:MAG: hypothetical protein BWK76_11365 [Desulfobulbaceae bacterium A2]|nr:MAG: hypothetical protein BWK76_11365 [Desulfobulbaceae bacterium A2]
MSSALLNLPLVLEADYVAWLGEQRQQTDSLHFPLPSPLRLDHRVQPPAGTMAELLAALHTLPGPRRYALLNSGWLSPELLSDSGLSRELIGTLEQLHDEGGLNGIVFGNGYLLQHLADRAPRLAALLEAVPGVNLRLDSPGRILSLLASVERTGFRRPARITLDRELNRDLPRLAEVVSGCRDAFPGLRLELLANEGCLPHCLCKAAHDGCIDMINAGLAPEHSEPLNRELGCIRAFGHEPWRLLTSPWIRPEDQHHYLTLVDGFKICGRTLGGAFLRRVATAFQTGRYDGNLLDLLDTPSWLAQRLYLDHRALPADFLQHSGSCRHDCSACGYCPALFQRIARPLSPRLPDLRRIDSAGRSR